MLDFLPNFLQKFFFGQPLPIIDCKFFLRRRNWFSNRTFLLFLFQHILLLVQINYLRATVFKKLKYRRCWMKIWAGTFIMLHTVGQLQVLYTSQNYDLSDLSYWNQLWRDGNCIMSFFLITFYNGIFNDWIRGITGNFYDFPNGFILNALHSFPNWFKQYIRC